MSSWTTSIVDNQCSRTNTAVLIFCSITNFNLLHLPYNIRIHLQKLQLGTASCSGKLIDLSCFSEVDDDRRRTLSSLFSVDHGRRVNLAAWTWHDLLISGLTPRLGIGSQKIGTIQYRQDVDPLPHCNAADETRPKQGQANDQSINRIVSTVAPVAHCKYHKNLSYRGGYRTNLHSAPH